MRGFRIGIVSPDTHFGRSVRERLDEGGLPVIELKLFEGEAGGNATLSQFGDDVVVTQPIDLDLLSRLDALFVGGGGSDLYNRVAADTAEQGVLTLVHGAPGLAGAVVHPGSKSPEPTGQPVILPRPESYLLGATLAKLARSHGIERATVTVLVPAQSRGDLGAAELHQQVVSLLNFKPPPTDVFEEQLAFNATLPDSGASAEAVRFETERLADMPSVLAVNLVQVPVFHAYCASMWVELSEKVEARALEATFLGSPFPAEKRRRSAQAPSPVGVAESNRIHVRTLHLPAKAASRNFWLWVVADSSFYSPADAALEVARTSLEN